MAVESVLIEKFWLTLVPKDGKALFSQAFKEFRAHQFPALAHAINRLQVYTTHEEQVVQVAAIQGLLTGHFMAEVSQMQQGKENLETWLEAYARHQGDNVVDFLQAKAGKT